jgi:DNA polymerase zeta
LKQSGIHIKGRVVLNVWRILRNELNLRNYSLQNCVLNVLGKRIPEFTNESLTSFFKSKSGILRHTLFKHLIQKTNLNLDLLSHLDTIHRTSELARIYGIEFFSVISRGSQYKVEGMMFRLSSPRNFFALSPSRKDVFSQNAPECIPLVMEPESKLYTSPVLVLDFQSLYPSMMIAYNLCFSTCLGKLSRSNKLGTLSDFQIPEGLLSELKDQIKISPNSVMFVNKEIREGILPRMLTEILETRVMVKKTMKNVNDEVLHKVLDARQHALKMISNVTYGYIAATFSGRMPCVDIADSVVQYGRETLEKVNAFFTHKISQSNTSMRTTDGMLK